MRKLILILTLFLLPLLAQAQISGTASSSTPHDSLRGHYLANVGIHEIWGSADDFQWRKIASVGDILAKHLVTDSSHLKWNADSTKLTTTYHGKVFLVDRADSLAGLAIGGYDSATVEAWWRRISKFGNTVSLGPWQYFGSVTFTNSTKHGSAAQDSLLILKGNTITYDTQWGPMVQFKYLVTSNKTLKGNGTRRTMSEPGYSQAAQEIWRGQVILRFKGGGN